MTYYDPATSPLQLSGLNPCTSYTIKISHITDFQACLPTEFTFTTECGYCEAVGLDAQAAHLDQFGFDVPGVVDWQDNSLDPELYPSLGYRYVTNPILRLEPNTPYDAIFCYTIDPNYYPTDVYLKMWIDFDGDSDLEATELVIDHSYANISGSVCFGPWPTLLVPSQVACNLRGRMMIGIEDEITSPCEDIPLGQVTDFLVNVGECEDDPN